MQWTTTGDRITLPYVAPEDDLQSTPATIKALAEAVVAELELATPVGAISPYMGDVAPDGWLMCDGSEYDPADLPELYAVNGDFHAPETSGGGVFRVPDLRGRSPIGIGNPDPTNLPDPTDHETQRRVPVRVNQLGERVGDWRVPAHEHTVWYNQYNGLLVSTTGGHHGGIEVGTVAGQHPSGGIMAQARSLAADSDSGYDQWNENEWADLTWGPKGVGRNIQPSTGVNFIVYAGRSTVGITPVPNGDMPAVTTLEMLEQRLAQKGIGEEEVKELKERIEKIKGIKERLEELKRTEAA